MSLSSVPLSHHLHVIEGNKKKVKVINCAAATWEKLARALEFSFYDIARIQRDNVSRCDNACAQVFREWLSGHGKKPTSWSTILTALKEAELTKVANDLESIITNKST